MKIPAGNKEYYYEYKEEKDPKGSYDRKDLHTVEVRSPLSYVSLYYISLILTDSTNFLTFNVRTADNNDYLFTI